MEAMMSGWHVYPLHDLIEHDPDSEDCICGPDARPEEREDGTIGWIIVHHSLDGRELKEPGRGGIPTEQP